MVVRGCEVGKERMKQVGKVKERGSRGRGIRGRWGFIEEGEEVRKVGSVEVHQKGAVRQIVSSFVYFYSSS